MSHACNNWLNNNTKLLVYSPFTGKSSHWPGNGVYYTFSLPMHPLRLSQTAGEVIVAWPGRVSVVTTQILQACMAMMSWSYMKVTPNTFGSIHNLCKLTTSYKTSLRLSAMLAIVKEDAEVGRTDDTCMKQKPLHRVVQVCGLRSKHCAFVYIKMCMPIKCVSTTST